MNLIDLKKTLDNVFGYKNYESDSQREACEIIYQAKKKDVLISTLSNTETLLCMQLTSVADKSGFTVIVTPTRALAKGQVQYLKTKNIPAFYWNACSSVNAKKYIREAKYPSIKILFLTYHQVLNSNVQFKLMQSRHNLSKFIIDKADYLSYQLKKYRKEFRNFDILKKEFPEVPIIAFTSSTTEEVREDVIHMLQLKTPIILNNKLCTNKESAEILTIESDSGESVEFLGEESIQHSKISIRKDKLFKLDNKLPKNKILNHNECDFHTISVHNKKVLEKIKELLLDEEFSHQESDSIITISD